MTFSSQLQKLVVEEGADDFLKLMSAYETATTPEDKVYYSQLIKQKGKQQNNKEQMKDKTKTTETEQKETEEEKKRFAEGETRMMQRLKERNTK